MIVRELQNFLRYLQRSLLRTPLFVKQLEMFSTTLHDPEKLVRELSLSLSHTHSLSLSPSECAYVCVFVYVCLCVCVYCYYEVALLLPYS